MNSLWLISLWRLEYLERVKLGIDEIIDGYPYEDVSKYQGRFTECINDNPDFKLSKW